MSEYDHELKALESRLKQWEPSPSAVKSSELLFEAGRRAGKRDRRTNWTSAMVGVVALALGFGMASWRQARHEPLADKPALDSSVAQTPQDQLPRKVRAEPLSYLAMTRSIVTSGEIESLPDTPVSTVTPKESFTPRSRLDTESID